MMQYSSANDTAPKIKRMVLRIQAKPMSLQVRQREKRPPLLHSKSKFAVMVTTQAVNQLASVATLPASPLILIGRICISKINVSMHKLTGIQC